MKRRKIHLKIFISTIIVILLILNPSTAAKGVSEGIEVCIDAVIPALFPFFIVTSYLNTALIGQAVPFLSPLCKSLKFPCGGDSLLLLGLIGGYPVGAQLISQSYKNRQISKRTSEILLGYCNNAGPAFIFGITGALFSSLYIPMILFGLQIISALITGSFLPRPEIEYIHLNDTQENTITSALKKSLNICIIVCSWIILFKVVLSYLNMLLKNHCGNNAMILIAGFIELSNGCLQLENIPSVSLRFIICSAFLSFGGLCVTFQTASAANGIGLGMYIHGKIMQTLISTIAAILLSFFLFPDNGIILSNACYAIVLCTIALLIVKGSAKRYGNSLKNSV